MANLIAGLVLLALGAWGVTAWWDEFGAVLRGLVPVALILVGLAAVGAGMKSRAKPKSEGEDGDPATSSDDASAAGRYRKAG